MIDLANKTDYWKLQGDQVQVCLSGTEEYLMTIARWDSGTPQDALVLVDRTAKKGADRFCWPLDQDLVNLLKPVSGTTAPHCWKLEV